MPFGFRSSEMKGIKRKKRVSNPPAKRKKKEDAEVPRKRIAPAWKEIPFPKFSERMTFRSLDLTNWAPSHESDLLLIAETVEVPVHKKALAAVSSVFRDIFKGDESVQRVKVKQASERVLKTLCEILYASPAERDRLMRTMDLHWTSLMKFTSEYDINILQELLEKRAMYSWFVSGKRYHQIIYCAKQLHFGKVASRLRNNAIKNRHHVILNTYEKDVVLAMIKANDFQNDKEFGLFPKALKYYVHSQCDKEIRDALEDIGFEHWSWKRKCEFESKKTSALFDILSNVADRNHSDSDI